MALVESFSGIRGIYGKGITDDIGVRYAYAFSSFLREKKKIIKVVIGRDTRVSGENLRLALIEGMDCDIIDAGVNSTPAIENAVREYKADGGIIITASHNEPEYNGFKFLGSDGAVLRPNEMAIIIEKFHSVKDMDEAEFLENLYKDNKMEHVKRVEKRENDALDRYKKFVLGFLDKKDKALIKNSGVKIVIDANGGAGVISKEIFDELGIDVVYLNMNKGIFKRKIEPNEGSLRYLVKVIKENKAEFAAGFDCDADRVEIILENGKLVSGNDILALIVDEILSGVKDASKETVVVNDATSYIVKEIVSKHKGKWKEVETGETNVVSTMQDFNSPVGGEGSNGGVILPPSRCRDGVLTLAYLFKILARGKKNLLDLVNSLPKYSYIKEKAKIKKDFRDMREKVMEYYLDKGFTIEETGDETGGIKAIKDSSWVWFRQSKTEDKMLRIIADSTDKKMADKLIDEGKRLIK